MLKKIHKSFRDCKKNTVRAQNMIPSFMEEIVRTTLAVFINLGYQKSLQRPPFSQSPYLVGSGPLGPPLSPVSELTYSPPSSSSFSSSLWFPCGSSSCSFSFFSSLELTGSWTGEQKNLGIGLGFDPLTSEKGFNMNLRDPDLRTVASAEFEIEFDKGTDLQENRYRRYLWEFRGMDIVKFSRVWTL